eukprot:8192872-Alexandrium_andersonii.AAC.1
MQSVLSATSSGAAAPDDAAASSPRARGFDAECSQCHEQVRLAAIPKDRLRVAKVRECPS